MDAQVPGLFDDMMRSRSEPLHYAVVERRIDALAPGLYAALAQTEDEGGDFRRSLLKVERALGVVHRPVEPV
jgi:hypothetical protein